MSRRRPLLRLTGGDLDAARAALAPPQAREVGVRGVLACAALMTGAALALFAVVLLNGGASPASAPAATEVRGALRR